MTKAQIRKKCFSEIHSDHVQLHFRKHGIWDYDGKCRIWLVLFTVCQSYRIYRGIPVCSDHIFIQWSFGCDDCTDSVSDEQQTDFLQPYFSEGFSEDGQAQALYDPHDDG